MERIHQAGLLNVIKTFFWLVLIYYILKFIVRWLFPFFLKRMVSSQKEKAERNTRNENVNYGETVIDKKPKRKNLETKNTEGEYIDFEEIE